MQRSAKALFLACITFVFGSCNGDQERYEKIEKLRALGVQAAPVTATPLDVGQTVTLTYYAAVPLGQTITAENFRDAGANYNSIDVTPDVSSATYVEHAQLQIYSIKASFTIPPKSELAPLQGEDFLSFRYGLKLTSGDETENIVGNYVIYAEGASQLAWADPNNALAASVAAPSAGGTISGKYDIASSINNPINESVRIGWFVSAGKLKARRARETQWDTDGKTGPQTLILTSRGMKSGSFAVQAVDVTVQ